MIQPRSLARPVSRRSLLTSGTAAAFSAAIPKLGHARQRPLINDASRLNPTPVARHWVVTPDAEAGFVDRLRAELKEAVAAKRAFAVGAARHSMGGQSLPRDGTAVTLATARCELDTAAGTFRVGAGTRWHQAIAVLDPAGF